MIQQTKIGVQRAQIKAEIGYKDKSVLQSVNLKYLENPSFIVSGEDAFEKSFDSLAKLRELNKKLNGR